jgi:hypothetical protein
MPIGGVSPRRTAMAAESSTGGYSNSTSRRALGVAALALGALWGSFLLLALVGSVVDDAWSGAVYLAFSILVWGSGSWAGLKRWRLQTNRVWVPVLIGVAASVLGPLALALLLVRRVRRAVLVEHDTAEQERDSRRRRVKMPESGGGPVARPAVPHLDPEVRSTSSVDAPRVRTRRKYKHPGWTLSWQLLIAILVFPAVGIVVASVLALGGVQFFTSQDERVIALVSGVAGGAAIAFVGQRWFVRAPERQMRRARLWGFVMIGVAVALVASATALFASAPHASNVRPPTVSGSPRVGTLLIAYPGRWNKPTTDLSFYYQWQICDPSCSDIYMSTGASARERTYRVEPTDVGERIRVAVAAGLATDWRGAASDYAHSSETARVAR